MKFTLQDFYGIIFYEIWSYEPDSLHRKENYRVPSLHKSFKYLESKEPSMWLVKYASVAKICIRGIRIYKVTSTFIMV
jgi:hypothetical protein